MKHFIIAIAGIIILLLAGHCRGDGAIFSYGDDGLPEGIGVDISYLSAPSLSVAPYRWYWNVDERFPLSFELVIGSSDISDGSDFSAIERALSSWSSVSGSSISASSRPYDGDWAALNNDNEIGWIESGWTSYYNFPENAIAVAKTWYYTQTLQQIETDILVDGENFSWYTSTDDSGTEQCYVEHILLHELGHAFSLTDLYNADDVGRTMYGYSIFRQEDVTLHPADEMALAYAYPVPEPSTGLIFLCGIFGCLCAGRKKN